MRGACTPIDTAFRNIRTDDPGRTSHCGLVHLAINRAHVYFEEEKDHKTAGKRLVFGCHPARQAYPYRGRKVDRKDRYQAVPGAYSISHGAGYGFLYQLTGDPKYAELARQCVEKGPGGQRNHDPRYSWVAPGGEDQA